MRIKDVKKVPFVTKEQVEKIAQTYPTPFHLYDEKGLRRQCEAVNEAFSWNRGFSAPVPADLSAVPSSIRIKKSS